MKLLVTGGAGFIGSALIRHLLASGDHGVLNVDRLTYAGSPHAHAAAQSSALYRFERADICDTARMTGILEAHRPGAIVHLAAESHVDRSIDAPADFIHSNVLGTYSLLEASLGYWEGLPAAERDAFRFHHVSTDEVYGALGPADPPFQESTAYAPNSPYAASKAASDHLVQAWYSTYGLPVLMSNCTNNYGPYQFPEKLIPLTIAKALAGEPIPVYGRGENVRDWIYVDDHVGALYAVLARARPGERYNISARCERANIDVVRTICALLDELRPNDPVVPHAELVSFVRDRPGHDLRYAMDASKIERELGWCARTEFDEGLARTVRWYLDNADWCKAVTAGVYDGRRLGGGRAGTVPA